MTIAGGCACGAVRYEGMARPGFAFLCQCRACQQLSGSGHLAQFTYPKDALHISGETASWSRKGESGRDVTKHLCAECGCPVYLDPDAAPELLMIVAATLDDSARFKPTKILHGEMAPRWDRPTLPQTDGDTI